MPMLETENHTLPCSAPGPLAPSSPNFIILHTSLRSLLLLEHGKLFSATGPLNVPVSPLRILIAEVTHSGTLSAISHQFTPLSIFFLFVPCRLYHFFFLIPQRTHLWKLPYFIDSFHTYFLGMYFVPSCLANCSHACVVLKSTPAFFSPKGLQALRGGKKPWSTYPEKALKVQTDTDLGCLHAGFLYHAANVMHIQ